MRLRNGPPPDMGRAVRWWFVGLLAGACMWALGCATGHVYETGEMYCAAIGEDAKVTYSAPQGDAGILTSAPTKLVYCEGGPVLPSILDGVGTVIKALFSWIVL